MFGTLTETCPQFNKNLREHCVPRARTRNFSAKFSLPLAQAYVDRARRHGLLTKECCTCRCGCWKSASRDCGWTRHPNPDSVLGTQCRVAVYEITSYNFPCLQVMTLTLKRNSLDPQKDNYRNTLVNFNGRRGVGPMYRFWQESHRPPEKQGGRSIFRGEIQHARQKDVLVALVVGPAWVQAWVFSMHALVPPYICADPSPLLYAMQPRKNRQQGPTARNQHVERKPFQ